MRFCRDQGFLGFQDFKLALAHEIATADRAAAPSVAEDGVQRLVSMAGTALRETEQLLDRSMLKTAATALASASIVTVYGAAASSITAKYLEYKLVRIGAKCRAFEDSHLALMTAATADASSAIVAVSSSGATRETVQFAELAQARGAYVVGITNRAKTPLTAKCSALFTASWLETPHTGGAFPSKVGQLLIIDALVDAILAQSPERGVAIHDTALSVTDLSF